MRNKLIVPSLRGVMGEWVYYSSLMTAEQISEWVLPAKDIRESKTLDELLQRDLNDRKKKIATYLQTVPRHFFNSIIVGVFEGLPDWLEFDITKTKKVIGDFEITGLNDSIGLLIFNGSEKMFAIDGQHRVAGIQIACEADNKKPEDERTLSDDQYSVLFVAHIDDFLGKKRTRKLFSDINKNAKPVQRGDKIKIDEEDLFAIVTRRIYAESPYFKKGKLISLTERESLDKDDNVHFTNLLGIYNTIKVLRPLYKKVPKTLNWDEENVQNLKKVAIDFFDFAFNNVDDYKKYFIDKSLKLIAVRKDNKNILFRPVGLKLIANLYVHFKSMNTTNEIIKSKLSLLSFQMPTSPFNKVLWNNGKMEAQEKNQKLAAELGIYLISKIHPAREKALLANYQEYFKDTALTLPKQLWK